MDGEIILKALGLLVFGTLFTWMGVDGLRHRTEERISLLEAAVLKAADDEAEPLPFNRWDKAMAYLQPVLFLIFGPLMILGGIAVFSLLGE